MLYPESKWVWQGHPGHFCCAKRCQFRMATRIGGILVSTVGELERPEVPGVERSEDQKWDTIGIEENSYYETMTFQCAAGEEDDHCAIIADLCELSVQRYSSAQEAHEGHMRLCYEVARGKIGRLATQ